MSTRWYPIYQKGNPQLRVFLPNFWLKLIKPTENQPNHVVQFHCSMEMTSFDIKNYLEKIYDVHPIKIRTRIGLGKTRLHTRFLTKDKDVKIAYVVLPQNETFTFPDVVPEDVKGKMFSSEAERSMNSKDFINVKKKGEVNLKKFIGDHNAPGVPTWFKT